MAQVLTRNPCSGNRDYNQTAVSRLSFILKAQSFGFRVKELRCIFVEGINDVKTLQVQEQS
jgi:DNA-binding transcriptional MerR regulator